ncbi:Toluene-4-sulfonate monooxygenase system iron-sulfur subunit TsaM1 [Variovorax sp. PBS-H4]|uniref:Rieske (2Fe-2S) protein n=1 Tax=Variovorax sp. PBS-H4 TaxID=434008 RepID=UPI001316D88E|nr:Rieske (2Fe-2S) protein [Variovorax sp. PBS-H4]VTU38834.1 Toluene-4-sulfonate monooxygenase system iron-sulfur subunit TsaM1 [Variovorax sp. PBS-H4]
MDVEEEQAGSAFAADGWFAVELSTHVPAGQVVQTLLHGQELALWRPSSGPVQAWENRCPHRSVRLTLGFVDGDQLVCRYHGWRYGSDGRCAGVPSTPALAPPPAACVRTYMCRESDGVIWASLALAPRGYPPRLPGLGACRSFVLDRAARSLADEVAHAGFIPGGHPSAWREPASSADAATLLLQPMNAETTCAHLFVAEGLSATRRLASAQRIKALFAKERSHA